jgi:hypothetical protein
VGLYNVLFGTNQSADELLAVLGLARASVGRFRDCYVSDGQIVVYTRNGGGNRECINLPEYGCGGWWGKDECTNDYCRKHHPEKRTSDGDCGDPSCYACIIEYRLPKHPCYIRDEDDEFDCTYASIYFRIPDNAALVLGLQDIGPWDPDKRWGDMLQGVKDGTVPIPREIEEVFSKLKRAISGEGGAVAQIATTEQRGAPAGRATTGEAVSGETRI